MTCSKGPLWLQENLELGNEVRGPREKAGQPHSVLKGTPDTQEPDPSRGRLGSNSHLHRVRSHFSRTSLGEKRAWPRPGGDRTEGREGLAPRPAAAAASVSVDPRQPGIQRHPILWRHRSERQAGGLGKTNRSSRKSAPPFCRTAAGEAARLTRAASAPWRGPPSGQA